MASVHRTYHTLSVTTALLTVFAVVTIGFLISTQPPIITERQQPLLRKVSRTEYTIPYCDRQRQQAVDLYLPYRYPQEDAAKTANPLVIYVHGGGWSTGDKHNAIADYYGSQFVAHGIAFASVSYRLAPAAHYPAQNDDVACAISTLASRADQYMVDPSRVLLFGDSAGSLLTSMYALTTERPPVGIKGVISFYGTSDLVYQLSRPRSPNRNAANYLGSTDLTLARRASPVYQPVTAATPPYIFFHGDKDMVVTREQAYSLYRRIRTVQPSSRFVTVKKAGHAFTQKTTPTAADIREIMLEFAMNRLGTTDDERRTTTTPSLLDPASSSHQASPLIIPVR